MKQRRDFIPMCDCKYVNNGQTDSSKIYMKPTKSKDGKHCDFCGYSVFRDYKGDESFERPASSFEPKKGKSTVSDWHRKD